MAGHHRCSCHYYSVPKVSPYHRRHTISQSLISVVEENPKCFGQEYCKRVCNVFLFCRVVRHIFTMLLGSGYTYYNNCISIKLKMLKIFRFSWSPMDSASAPAFVSSIWLSAVSVGKDCFSKDNTLSLATDWLVSPLSVCVQISTHKRWKSESLWYSCWRGANIGDRYRPQTRGVDEEIHLNGKVND